MNKMTVINVVELNDSLDQTENQSDVDRYFLACLRTINKCMWAVVFIAEI